MKLCDYGCGQKSKYYFEVGKWCCSKNHQSCPVLRKKNSKAVEKAWKDPVKRKNIINADNRPEVKEKVSKTSKEYWNKPGVKEKQREYMLNGGASYINSFNKNPSRPQVKTYENTKQLYEEAILNYPFLNYSLDIGIESIKLDIEYDETWWHVGYEDRREHDKKRDEYLKSLGWKVLRYRDYIPTKERLKEDIEKILK